MAVIGISGKIGSGKDTVGRIIQYLTNVNKFPDRFHPEDKFEDLQDCWNEGNDGQGYQWKDGGWVIKKFATKLKEICSILTDIPVEDFEKEDIKNSQLPDSYTLYKYILNIDGHLLTSKDIYSSREEAINEGIKDINYSHVGEGINNVRWLLQTVGTEAMRKIIHENVWINALFIDYKSNPYLRQDGQDSVYIDKYPNWIITDVRFPNELKAIEDKKGITIRISRDTPCSICKLTGREQIKNFRYHGGCKEITCPKQYQQHKHPSEVALDNATFKYTIDNNSTIEELVQKVKEILIKETIINN